MSFDVNLTIIDTEIEENDLYEILNFFILLYRIQQ